MPSTSGKPKKPDKHKSERQKPGHTPSKGGSPAPLSFLFFVNELGLKPNITLPHDEWFNDFPPRNFGGYNNEIPSSVMRYYDGRVERSNYRTSRFHLGGGMSRITVSRPDEMGHAITAEQYKVLATFSCNPQLPFVILDGDPFSQPDTSIQALFFHHPKLSDGVAGLSQVVTPESDGMEPRSSPCKFVACHNPSWMPYLVPDIYTNPYVGSGGQRSKGLGGELPVVIALMAFSEAYRDSTGSATEEIFLGSGHRGGRWVDRKWTHNHKPRGYTPSSKEDPRGFLVGVFLDPDNPQGSTHDRLFEFEWKRAIVKDS